MKKTKIFLIAILLIICILGGSLLTNGETNAFICNAVTNQKSSDGAEFLVKQYKDGNSYYQKIIMEKNGKKQTVATKTTSSFTVKGNFLYYVKQGELIGDFVHYGTVYQYNVKTGGRKKIISGTGYYGICACKGNYIYCTIEDPDDCENIKLYAFNLKTKKKMFMKDFAGGVYVLGNKVISGTYSGDADNYPIYSFSLNGTGKKKIADADSVSVKHGKLYYAKVNTNTWKYKVYTCSPNGKNKKAITGWVKQLPKKYFW